VIQLFVGTWPTAEVQEALAAYPRPDTPGLRWSMPTQWFVKIRPLGYVEEALVPELTDVLRAELDGAPATPVSLGPVSPKGWLHAPVTGLDDLTAVVFEVTEPLVPVTHPQPWHAELVLARAAKIPRQLVAPLEGSWTVEAVSLAKGTRGTEGPGYEDLEVFPLG
jgi:hypothetical protein